MIHKCSPLTAMPLLLIALAFLLSSGQSHSAELQVNQQVVDAVQSGRTSQINLVIEGKTRIHRTPAGISASGAHIESTSWEAVHYAAANGSDFTDLSIGRIQCVYNPTRAMWRTVLEDAMGAGAIATAAAGDEGKVEGEAQYCPPPSKVPTPGDVPGFITAGAVRETSEVPPFSRRGPVTWEGESEYCDLPYTPGLETPAIRAPGVRVDSTTMGGQYSGDYWSGISISLAHVAGAVALLLEIKPLVPPTIFEQHMMDSAAPANDPRFPPRFLWHLAQSDQKVAAWSSSCQLSSIS